MTCRSRNLAFVDPFRAVRSQFSKEFGMPTEAKQGGRVTESDSEVILQIDLPGVDSADLDMTVEDGLLTITGSRQHSGPEGGRPLFVSEQTGEFQRSFRLNKSLDAQCIDAVMDLGVLTVTIPKRPEVMRQSIPIRSATTE